MLNTFENPFSISEDLFENESRDHIQCPNCNYNTVYTKIDSKKFWYEEWESKAKFANNNSKVHVKMRIPDAIKISKMLNMHPTRVFNQLVSSYWSAWDWDICEQNAIESLKCTCLNCGFDLEYLKK